MKIEKLSDNQIRCTLSKEDLIDRELRISELAYGSEKAKQLFRDMMQQASYEFGFEADDIPLMIEAIPVSTEGLILVITKVEDPDELDTRFSNFSPYTEHDENNTDDEETEESYADEILNYLGRARDILAKKDADSPENTTKQENEVIEQEAETDASVSVPTNLSRTYSFASFSEVTALAHIISSYYNGDNTLYKDPLQAKYYLVIYMSEHTPSEFNKICNIISEFGKVVRTNYASTAYYEEHFDLIVKHQAVQVLSKY